MSKPTFLSKRAVFAVLLGAAVAGSAGIGRMVGPAEIHDAVKAGDVAKVKALLDADPALVRARDETGRTPLHWAARGTNLPILTMVVEKGAELNAVDSGGIAPLHSLASRGYLDGIRLLLDRGADVNLPSAEGQTPLHFAALGGHVQAMRVLAARQADLERADDYGRTPLILAAREMSGPAVVLALLELGARIDAADKGGDTALNLAAWRGSADVVGLLLEKRAAIPVNTPRARGLLENAVDRGLETLFQRMVELGADLSIVLSQNRTLLHSAAEGGSVPIIRTLIDRTFELNRKDASGWTPLHYAVDMGRTEAVALLLAHGAEIDARTVMGQTAFNIASENGDADLAAALASKGADKSAPRFPELVGEYFGQKKPGPTPEIFAPGIVSARYGMHSNVVFSPDGTEAFWSLMIPPRGTGYSTGRTLVSRLADGRWTYPRPAVFEGVPLSDVPFFHPNGRQLFDMSRRPIPGGPPGRDEHIWVWDKGGADGWTNPRPVDGTVNTLPQHWQFSVDRAGTLYFNSTWNGVSGIFRSRLVGGRYAQPESVGARINRGDGGGGFPFIAPDGSYLLFTRNQDIHVSFREAGGAWGEPVGLGPEYRGILPIVSPDGRYVFFSRGFRAYWVEASVIERQRRPNAPAGTAGEIPVPGGRTRRTAEVEAAVRSAFQQGNIKAAAVAVVTGRGPVFERAVGVRVGGAGGPADDDTVFRAASLSKPVFAYLALTLVKDGRLDLDRPLHTYLPKRLSQYPEYADLAGDSRYEAITARHVLTHRTGFPNWRWQAPDRKLRILFDPGTKFSYSGEGYKYLQFVVEQVTGSSLETLAAQRVLTPLGMSRTSFLWRDEYGANSAIDRAPIEKFFGPGFLALPNAAGSLLTTARDYGRFLTAVLAGTGLPSGLRDEMLRPHATIAAESLFGPPAATGQATGRERAPYWCLGWGGFADDSGAARFHVGYDSPEYANYAVLYPESHVGVVVLTAGGTGPDTSCPRFVEALLGRTSTPFRWMGY